MDYQDWQANANNHFWYQARQDLITRLLKSTNIKLQSTIMEIGCGTGYQLDILTNFGNCLGLDIHPEAVQIAQKKHQVTLADINTYNLPANTYEIICLFDVLEHLPDDDLIINKIKNSLKPSGYLLMTVPAHQWLFSTHDQAMLHYRRYSKKQLKQLIEKYNLEIVDHGYWNSLLFLPLVPLRLLKKFAHTKPKSEAQSLPKPLNNLLGWWLKQETKFLTHPLMGSTIYLIAKKNEA